MRAGIVLVLLVSGCTHRIAPPATPDEITPQFAGEMGPLAEGSGRLVVDVVDGPTAVGTIVAETTVVGYDKDIPITASRVSTRHLCDAPCSIDLEAGRWDLTFATRGDPGRLEVGEVNVEPGVVTVYRRSLGSYDPAGAGLVLGIVGTVLGGMSMITGTVLLPIGLSEEEDGMATAGWITLGVGAVLVAAGILGMVFDPHLEQPGADMQFSLGPPAVTASASVEAEAGVEPGPPAQ